MLNIKFIFHMLNAYLKGLMDTIEITKVSIFDNYSQII